MKPRQVLAATTLFAASFCAGAQTMKPGLWEINNRMQTGSGQLEQNTAGMQQEMARMTPEERKMMQDMMAKQGVNIGAGGPGAASLKVCMTREMVERSEVPVQRGECKHVTSPRSGNTVKMSFTCSKPPSSGDGEIIIVSPEAYTMKMTMSTVVDGKAEKVSMNASGKWLSADCGAVKPMGMPAK